MQSMNELQTHYAQLKNLHTKVYLWCDSIQAKLLRQEADNWSSRWAGRRGVDCKSQEGSIWDNGTVYLDCSGSYTIVGICQNSYIEMYTKKGEFYLMQLSLQSKKKKIEKKRITA